ncbi:hypothetical protein V8C42DRAFT_266501 [Trichoderma barbatum]
MSPSRAQPGHTSIGRCTADNQRNGLHEDSIPVSIPVSALCPAQSAICHLFFFRPSLGAPPSRLPASRLRSRTPPPFPPSSPSPVLSSPCCCSSSPPPPPPPLEPPVKTPLAHTLHLARMPAVSLDSRRPIWPTTCTPQIVGFRTAAAEEIPKARFWAGIHGPTAVVCCSLPRRGEIDDFSVADGGRRCTRGTTVGKWQAFHLPAAAGTAARLRW